MSSSLRAAGTRCAPAPDTSPSKPSTAIITTTVMIQVYPRTGCVAAGRGPGSRPLWYSYLRTGDALRFAGQGGGVPRPRYLLLTTISLPFDAFGREPIRRRRHGVEWTAAQARCQPSSPSPRQTTKTVGSGSLNNVRGNGQAATSQPPIGLERAVLLCAVVPLGVAGSRTPGATSGLAGVRSVLSASVPLCASTSTIERIRPGRAGDRSRAHPTNCGVVEDQSFPGRDSAPAHHRLVRHVRDTVRHHHHREPPPPPRPPHHRGCSHREPSPRHSPVRPASAPLLSSLASSPLKHGCAPVATPC